MKKAFFILLPFLLLGSNVVAQNNQEAISKRVGEYFSATEKKDWAVVMDLIYPKLFTFIPKENMAQVFEDLESEGMAVQMRDFGVTHISPSTEHQNEKFALVHYNVSMNIRFTSQELRDSTVQASLKESFESSYGAGNVAHHPEDFSFDIKAARSMFAVADQGSDAWFFVENDPSQEALTGMLIPEEVRKQLSTASDKRN
jgi:hypothetical protein